MGWARAGKTWRDPAIRDNDRDCVYYYLPSYVNLTIPSLLLTDRIQT